MRIYYLNKHWDAAGFGHAGVIIPSHDGSCTYYSFFASRRFVPFCPGTLLVKEFASADEALAYAKEEGYTREIHWSIDPTRAAAARAAIQPFATGSRWRLLSRNCWNAVYEALKAAGVEVTYHGIRPNRNFERNKHTADGWSLL